MKAGYLVRVNSAVTVKDWLSEKPIPVDHNTIGMVMEVDEDTAGMPTGFWVKWHGNWDWDICYLDDLEVVSSG